MPFDHTHPTEGGLTIESNLVSFCRRHHRFKTFTTWTYRLDPDGTLTITTDQGDRMVTHGDGPLARYRHTRHHLDSGHHTHTDHTHTDTDTNTDRGDGICRSEAEDRAAASIEAIVEARAWKRQQGRNPDPGHASAPGGADTVGLLTESSWARREARRRARAERQRAHNAEQRRRREDRRTGKFDALSVSTTPTVLDFDSRRARTRQASSWWENNRHRYQHLRRGRGRGHTLSLLEERLTRTLATLERESSTTPWWAATPPPGNDPDDPPPF